MIALRTSAAAVALTLVAATVAAQSPFRHSGADTKHTTYSPLPNESIDPASGALTLVATDLVLPGNAGFDLRVTRVYNSNLYPGYDSGSTALDEDSWAGIGWRLHFGRVLNPDATTGGATSIEFGDGSRQPLYTTTAYPEGWITPGFARYDRGTHTLKLPNGYVYTFGHVADLGGTLGIVRYVTEIRDPFNNRIEFSYFGAPGPVDGVSQIRQYLSATQVRTVNFTYDGARNSLATMNYNGRTWTYVHDPSGASGHSVLREVHGPLGPAEHYDYTVLPGELTRVETPSGGVVAYTYADAYRKASTLTHRTRVVTERASSGRAITPGVWTFAYGTGSNEDTTLISCTCGAPAYPTRTKYRFHGTGLTGDFSGWKSGALADIVIEQSDGVVIERQEFTWVRSEPISQDPVPGENGVWSDAAVYTALLQSTTTTRGPQSWTTTHEYHTASFNDFGQPWKTTQTGDFTRTVERTFQGGFTPHIVGRVSSVTTRVGPESVVATWEFDLATGFLTAYTGPRSPRRRFTATADGNLASEKDALNNETFYENYTWGKPQRVRTPTTTSDFSINGDGMVDYGGNAVVVHYLYDDLFRQTKTWSVGVNPVFTKYDNVAATTSWFERDGTVQGGATVDGFARTIESGAAAGVKVRTTYDACGRPVFTSMPFTAGTGSVGTTTAYDFLGRVSSVTAPDGGVTQYSYTGIDVTVTDAEGRATFYDFSAAGSPDGGRLVAVRDAANVTTTYGYDVIDSLIRVSGPGAVPDRTWAYDGLGLLLGDTQPESGTTTYVNDVAGNVTRKTDAKQVLNFTYDADNRLETVDAPGTADDVTLTYDQWGRLSTQATSAASTTFTYHATGHLASRTDTVGTRSFTSTYAYDLDENLTSITYPSGRVVAYEYDVYNRLTTVRQNGAVFADQFTYDDGGRLASYRTGTVVHSVTYDAAGRTRTLTSGSALNLTYTYDRVGNVTTIAEPSQPTQTFGYDTLNRLTSASGSWGNRGWQYTPAGDRLTETGTGTTSYQYDAATRRLMSTSGARTESFTYSPIGEMTSDARGAYTYNGAGLVTQFTGPNVGAAYAYDPSGLRIAKTVNSITTFTARSAGGSVLSEFRDACGSTLWDRDVIYAGGRLLGSIKATNTEPTVSLAQSSPIVSEGTATLNATVSLTTFGSGPLACPLTVSYSAIGATAHAGADFRLTAGSVTFTPGDVTGATRTIILEILNDTTDEEDETLNVTLSSAVGATVGTATQTITITDDDAPPSVSIGDGSAVEGHSGSSPLPLTLTLSAVSGKSVTVTFATNDGTAVVAADYLNATGQVTFAPGEISKTVNMFAVGDSTREIDEYFTVTLSGPVNVTLADATGVANILDDDRPPIAQKSDFNLDGKPDLLWAQDSTRNLAVWLMDGTIMTSVAAPSPGQGDAGQELIGTGDAYADGTADLFWRNTTTGDVTIWVMSGTNRVATQSISPQMGDPNWRAAAVADINGDTHPDVVWRHSEGWVAMSTLVGHNMTTVQLLTPNAVSADWSLVATGDLDQDGLTDLVWQNDTNGDLVWWRLNGTALVSSEPMNPGSLPNLQWKIRGSADLDADGMTDLLWQNTVTGEIGVWLMNGTSLRTSLYTTPSQLADLTWRIVAPK
jgi:YD repeat-containing protein